MPKVTSALGGWVDVPSLLCPLIYPGVDRLVPQPAVLRLEHPVAFVGKIQHLRRHALHLQGGEKLEAFADVESVIALAVDYERGRLEILRVLVWRPLLIQRAIVIGRAFELPVVEPKFFVVAPA